MQHPVCIHIRFLKHYFMMTDSSFISASFASHAIWRDMEEFIAKQEVDNKVDLMFGGGLM